MATWAKFFGPQPDGAGDAPAAGPLPDAYKGDNAFLRHVVQTVVLGEPVYLLHEALPWCPLESFTDQTPVLARYGIAGMLKHDFALSEEGLASYNQIFLNTRDAVLATASLGAVQALVDAAPPAPAPEGLTGMLDAARAAGVAPTVLLLPKGSQLDVSGAATAGLRVEYVEPFPSPASADPPIQPLERDGERLAVLAVAGEETGRTVWDRFDVKLGDGPPGFDAWVCTVHIGTVITRPENVLVFSGVQ